jgi:hypothetical protein
MLNIFQFSWCIQTYNSLNTIILSQFKCSGVGMFFIYDCTSQVYLIPKWTIRHSNIGWYLHRFLLGSARAPCCVCLLTETCRGSPAFQMQPPVPPSCPRAQNMMHCMTNYHPPSKWAPGCRPYWSTHYLFINYTSVSRGKRGHWEKRNYLGSVLGSD